MSKNAKVIATSTEITDRYRITSLVRRSLYIQLFLAIDTSHQRPVVIRDIDISNVDDEIYTQALDIVQGEYDLLHRLCIPDVLVASDLHYSQDHLLIIQDWPFPLQNDSTTRDALTLHDLIQSGIGLPDEETAINWTSQLCNAVQRLHNQQIIIGDLDPHVIAVSEKDYAGQLALMISWLPATMRKLLPDAARINNLTSFNAPETQEGNIDPGSDIYSLGAILYLLLTGIAPTRTLEETREVIQPPRELNAKISNGVEAVVMKALELDNARRFATIEEFAEALRQLSSNTKTLRLSQKSSVHKAVKQVISQKTQEKEVELTTSEDVATVVINSKEVAQAREHLERLAANRAKAPGKQAEPHEQNNHKEPIKEQTASFDLPQPTSTVHKEIPIEDQSTVTISKKEVLAGIEQAIARKHEQQKAVKGEDAPKSALVLPEKQTSQALIAPAKPAPVPQEPASDWRKHPFLQRFSDVLPAISALTALTSLPRHLPARLLQTSTALQLLTPTSVIPAQEQPLLQRLRHIFIGEQQHSTTAVVLIETPLRVQPHQHYHLRISVMGRDEPGLPPGAPPDMELSGLSALARGDRIHIEVQTALIQNYAYILQQADVEIPSTGYAAEVTIPLQAIPDGSGTRRERLHINFTDEAKQPLYEKPFVVELFISSHVQAGREGHNVLTIPL
jgi:serine/threonine protein kinase